MRRFENDNCEGVRETNRVFFESPTEEDTRKLERETEKEGAPEHEYEANGYKYRANDNGQILHAEGDLRLGDGERDAYAQRKAGGEYRREEDDGGHLIGSRFDGYGGEENLIAQDKSVNRGGYKSLENEWADALKDGKNVHVEIDPVYHGDSPRPDIITGKSEISDGKDNITDYFSMTNDNLEKDEFKLPDDDQTDVYPNAMDYDHDKYEKELR